MSNRRITALVVLTLVLSTISATVGLSNAAAPRQGASAAIAALTVAALLGVGLYAWRREGEGRFGQVLFATGLCWFVASLSNSDVELLYSVGRVAVWIFEMALIYALLSYPSGRLETRPARLVFAAAAVLVATLYLPTVPFVEQYPLPSPFANCAAECPPNAFFAGSEPAVLADVVKPLREGLTIVLYVLVVVVLSARIRAAGHNLKRTLVPVLGAGALRFSAAGLYIALRRAEGSADVMEIASLVAQLTIGAAALGFLVGLLQWQVYSGRALAGLSTGLAATRNPAQLRALLAQSLAEPAVELYYAPPPADGGARCWLDSSSEECSAKAETPHNCLAEAEAESGLRVCIVCDRGFREYPSFLRAVASCAISGLERQRLDAALSESLEDVAASRKRLAGTADGARRKIERDLHDGAQQHLVALRVKLELAREALERHSDSGTEMVADLAPEVDEIIEEVRSLARGIYPPLLASSGLGEALRAAGQRSHLAVLVSAEGLGRFPSETESAVYFCCLEALQNASKHAAGASGIRIELRREDDLLFEVSDDGCGFATDHNGEGSGITGMRDRLAAVGGDLRIESSPGAGTSVLGRVSIA
ncbi:MAG TPA: histidine kinase [Solirubrobacterales bacterium]|nr:histidine kinase [Solirubrobacterales bacterium]